MERESSPLSSVKVKGRGISEKLSMEDSLVEKRLQPPHRMMGGWQAVVDDEAVSRGPDRATRPTR